MVVKFQDRVAVVIIEVKVIMGTEDSQLLILTDLYSSGGSFSIVRSFHSI